MQGGAVKSRLGLDIGTNSIGWWLYRTEGGQPVETLAAGVRVFSDGRDPKSKASLAQDRRQARAMRRRRDRYLRRRASLMRKMASAGLMPEDEEAAKALERMDPFEIRSRALDEAVPLQALGRAFFQLNQRRGFKSNRKTDRGDNEGGKIREAAARLDQAMMAAGARSYGEFLHRRRAASPDRPPAVRSRLTKLTLSDGKMADGYDFYPERRHLEAEFNLIWESQARFHAELNDALRAELFETIFHQRPLRPPKVGRCLYFDERRAPRAHPLVQRRILLETVNALRIRTPGEADAPLTIDQRNALILAFDAKTSLTLKSARLSFKAMKRVLRLPEGAEFSLESAARDGIDCDHLRAIFAHTDRIGPRWGGLGRNAQWELIEKVREAETDEDHRSLVAWLQEVHGLTEARALKCADAPLPEGHGRLGLTATARIVAALEAEVIPYSEAVERTVGHHSDFRTGELLDRLPYYGEILDRHVVPGSGRREDGEVEFWGRMPNPTVHIGLGQLRRVVNLLIEKYGKPSEIVVELARELKLSKDQKDKVNKSIAANTKAAIARSKQLAAIGQRDTGGNRLLLRLWEEQGDDPLRRFCPYSGKTIALQNLFDGSTEVDHILPFSRTLDDSVANRVVCYREANREKRNRAPWEAWGGAPARWDTIASLLDKLPANKRWRFAPDAMTRFEDEKDFLARQLVDTQHLSRMAREYLACLYPDPGTAPVYVVPGRMTEMLRRHWGLNFDLADGAGDVSKEKNRSDHRHHAIDAAVIGATDRSLIQRLQKASARREQEGLEQVVGDVEPPFEGFRGSVRAALDRIVVSHRVDHGAKPGQGKRGETSGALHNDTAYGLTDEASAGGVPCVVTRKPLSSLQKPADLAKIRDPDLRALLEDATQGLSGKDFAAAVDGFAEADTPYRGLRRVRQIEPLKVIPIADEKGRAYKGYKGDSNDCYEVWRLPDGSWERVVPTTFQAHQPGYDSRPHPAAKLLMRIRRKDVLALDHPKTGAPVRMIVAKLSAQRLDLAPLTESEADRRSRDKEDPFDFTRISLSLLRKSRARKVHVDELGAVRDPGPPNW